LLVSNAGVFSKSALIKESDNKTWDDSIALNLNSHRIFLKICLPYLELGIESSVVFVGSKNVPAPGPGASSYSVAKAGLTQLARVAALELGKKGIRVNIVHPNAVFDTGIWTDEVLRKRAAQYDVTVEQYKKNNILQTEVTSRDVAAVVLALLGPAFSKTTGAQVPIDGGNERVI
jgi:NAD(P)-dependent dehydrogenase (short-subunit alcohol dehydrogenase family)